MLIKIMKVKKLIVPNQLKQFTNQQYQKLTLKDPPSASIETTKNDIGSLMNKIAPQLIGSIIQNNSCWYFVTQSELYVSNSKHIDDCGTEQPYPSATIPKTIIDSKSCKGAFWNKFSVHWGEFELLVTGGLTGTINGLKEISAFLGPALSVAIPSYNKMTFCV